jgi:hypothetical protein
MTTLIGVQLALLIFLQAPGVVPAKLPRANAPIQSVQTEAAFRKGNLGADDTCPDTMSRQEAEYEERRLEDRFNHLINALQDFASTYKNGHVIDFQKVKALRKALHEFQKLDLFKDDSKQQKSPAR